MDDYSYIEINRKTEIDKGKNTIK